MEQQTQRTRKGAEVFTPAWLCNKMNNFCDEEWFGYKDVFNRQTEHKWIPTEHAVEFPKEKNWKNYVDSRRLEITCGEAPYLVSRYDASTGEFIEVHKRIGMLDRKLHIVNENAGDETEWMKWVDYREKLGIGFDDSQKFKMLFIAEKIARMKSEGLYGYFREI